MQAGNTNTLTLPTVTPEVPSSEYTLGSSKLTGFDHEQSRICDSLSRRQRSKSVDTEVDTNGYASFGQRLLNFIQNQSNEISPITALGYRHSSRRAYEGSRPVDVEPTKFCKCQRLISTIPLESALRIFSRLISALFLERRIAGNLIEEVFESRLKMSERLLGWNARNFVEPFGSRLLFEFGKRSGRGVVVDWFTRLIPICAQSKRPVVDESATAKGFSQLFLLLISRVTTEPISKLHKFMVALVKSFVKLSRSGVSSAA
jgi:hypothetical protein